MRRGKAVKSSSFVLAKSTQRVNYVSRPKCNERLLKAEFCCCRKRSAIRSDENLLELETGKWLHSYRVASGYRDHRDSGSDAVARFRPRQTQGASRSMHEQWPSDDDELATVCGRQCGKSAFSLAVGW